MEEKKPKKEPKAKAAAPAAAKAKRKTPVAKAAVKAEAKGKGGKKGKVEAEPAPKRALLSDVKESDKRIDKHDSPTPPIMDYLTGDAHNSLPEGKHLSNKGNWSCTAVSNLFWLSRSSGSSQHSLHGCQSSLLSTVSALG
jgi:hypothetical protein